MSEAILRVTATGDFSVSNGKRGLVMNIGLTLVRIAAVYMLLGLAVGLAMGITGNYALMSAHSHILLLGWATMALAGLLYLAMPGCGRSRLAIWHAWGHNAGLPVMVAGLVLLAQGLAASTAEKVTAAGSALVTASLALFAVNVVKNGRAEPTN